MSALPAGVPARLLRVFLTELDELTLARDGAP